MNEIILVVECPICHKEQEIRVYECDYELFCQPNRPNIQVCFPYLNADEREALITGICPTCWDEMFA